MEKPSIVFVVLCMIFAISVLEVNCNEKSGVCSKIDDSCSSDKDCCTFNCRRSIYIFKKYCRDTVKEFHPLRSPLMEEVIGGKCSYIKSQDSEQLNDLNSTQKVTASNLDFRPGTMVYVIINNTVAEVQINERFPNTTDYLLDLSEAAAKILGITKEGVYDCEMKVPLLKNCVFMQGFLIGTPVVLTIVGYILFNIYG